MIRLRLAVSAALSSSFLAVLLSGCGAGVVPPDAKTVTTPTQPSNGIPQITLSPTALAFPNTVVGQTSAAQTITVGNTGTAALVFSNIALSNTLEYGFTSTCGTSLAVNTNCTLSVVFHPTTAVSTGTGAIINFTDNSGNVTGAQQAIALAGVGTPSTTPAPIISITPTALTFPDTTVGATSAVQTVTVANIGNATLTISDISTGDPQDYTLNSTCGTTLAASATCTLSVSFHPGTTGALPATINFTDNSNNVSNAQQTVSLAGNGLSAGVPIATLSAATLAFPDTTVNTTSAALTFSITNTGTANLLVTTSSGFNSTFANTATTCTSGSVSSIAPGAQCTYTVTFTPTAVQSYSAAITFTDNSNGVTGATQTVTLTGSGLSAANNAVTLTPEPMNFPDTTVGNTSAALTATLHNGGTTTLTGLAPALSTYATSKAFAVTGTTCGTTLAAGASCTYSITFAPFVSGNYQAYFQVTDSAANSPQQIDIFGNGVQATLTLSTASMSFPTTTVGKTATQTSTLTNTGGATANLTGITYSGSPVFASTNTCGATLAGGASCVITATFTPTAAVAYTGTINITSSNATPAALSIALSGSGTTSAVSYNLYEWPDPGTGSGSGILNALYTLVDNAQKTIDITMYALQDTTFSGKLVNACKRGVIVRAVLDQNGEKSNDTPAYNQLNAQANCSAVWANKAFSFTHEKTFVVDNTTIALLSGNLQSQYYSTTRDYAMVYNDATDVAAIEATFAMDYAAGTPPSGVAGASDFSYVPDNGTDLIWSPTTAKQKMLDIINNATVSLNVENEELASSASYIINAIAAQCTKGLAVRVLIENSNKSTYNAGMQTLKNAGCPVHYYYSSSGFYIHAKDVVADYGLPTQASYMGSINYSNGSMTLNRELGMNITDQASVALLYNTFVTDYNAAYVF